MPLHRIAGVLVVASLAALGLSAGDSAAATAPVDLGTASGFAVSAATSVTNTGNTTLNGDLGVSPGTSITGFDGGPGVVNGTIHNNDTAAAQAQADVATAYGDAAGRASEPLANSELGGRTLTSGVYSTNGGFTLVGTAPLTLDGQGNPDAVFILQAATTLATAAATQVQLIGDAQACNVFWELGTSATLGAGSGLDGTILAGTSISIGDDSILNGRALVRTAAVSLSDDAIVAPQCASTVSNTAPSVAPFSVKLTGVTQTVHTSLGAWSVTDNTGSDNGYSVTVSATNPTVNGSTAAAGTGASVTLTPPSANAASGNPATTGPVAESAQALSTTPATIENARAGTGQGEWDFAADSGGAGTGSLAIDIPGNASAGAFSSTLTFTTAPPAG
jgi:hypothetical protein